METQELDTFWTVLLAVGGFGGTFLSIWWYRQSEKKETEGWKNTAALWGWEYFDLMFYNYLDAYIRKPGDEERTGVSDYREPAIVRFVRLITGSKKPEPSDPVEVERWAKRIKFSGHRPPLFGKGDKSQVCRHIVYGSESGVESMIMHFTYTNSGHEHDKDTDQTVLRLRFKGADFPKFALAPEGLWDKLFGGQDIDFSMHPKFSKMFQLQGENEQAIRSFFTPELIAELESWEGWSVEAHREDIIFYRHKKLRKSKHAEELKGQMERLRQIFAPHAVARSA